MQYTAAAATANYYRIYHFYICFKWPSLPVGADELQEKAGRLWKNLMDIIRRDLKDMVIAWDEAEELATYRAEWHQCVAQWMN